MRKPLVIAIAVRRVGPDVLTDPCPLLGKNLGITHTGDSKWFRAAESG
jgi:hypothetical protein